MATPFNPPLQYDPGQTWENWRPAQEPMVDISGETRGKAIGKGLAQFGQDIHQGLEVADVTQKKYIGEGMAKEHDVISGDETNRLMKLADYVTNNPNNVLQPTGSKELPPDLKQYPGMVDDMIALKASGQYSPIYTDMRFNSMVQGYRAKFGGQREFIDAENTRLTHEDPANKVRADLTSYVNSYIALAKEGHNKEQAQIDRGVNEAAITPMERLWFMQNPNEERYTRLMQKVYNQAKVKLDTETTERNLRVQEGQRKVGIEEGQSSLTNLANARVSADMFGSTVMVDEFHDPQKMTEFLNDWRSGKVKLTSEQGLAIAQRMTQDIEASRARAMYDYTKVDDITNPKAKSLDGYAGGKGKEITDAAYQRWERVRDLFAKGEVAEATMSKSLFEADISDAQLNMIKDLPWMKALVIAGKADPQGVYKTRALSDLITDKNKNDAYDVWTKSMGLVTIGQPKLDETGVPWTISDTIKDGQKKGIQGPDGAKAYQKIIDLNKSTITDPSAPDELKKNCANCIFGSKDLMELVQDSTVKADGTISPGKSTLFADVVNDHIGKDIKKMDITVQQKYVDSAHKWGSNILMSEFKELDKNAQDPNITFHWENKEPRLVVDFAPISAAPQDVLHGFGDALKHFVTHGTLPNYPQQDYPVIQNSVDKINLMIQSLNSVGRQITHQDTNEVVFKMMIEAGLDPRKIDPNSAPGKIMQALLTANMPQPKPTKPEQEGIPD